MTSASSPRLQIACRSCAMANYLSLATQRRFWAIRSTPTRGRFWMRCRRWTRNLNGFEFPKEHPVSGVEDLGDVAERWLLEGTAQDKIGLKIDGLCVEFPGVRTSLWRKPSPFTALQDVSFEVKPGGSPAWSGRVVRGNQRWPKRSQVL